jgi:hypothetical protein
MELHIKPLWDPSDTVSVELDEDRRELVVRAGAERRQFVLREQRRGRLHWVERSPGRRGARNVPVSVGEVVCHCLREYEAEARVCELSADVAARALARGGRWAALGRRLADQARAAQRVQRVSTLPFQVLFEHHANAAREEHVTARAADRAGYLMADGRADTQQLLRRIGLARDQGSAREARRSVQYDTAVALCRAVEVEPVELGL